MIAWMEGDLILLKVALLVLNQKSNLTNSQYHKVQQEHHFGTKNSGQQDHIAKVSKSLWLVQCYL